MMKINLLQPRGWSLAIFGLVALGVLTPAGYATSLLPGGSSSAPTDFGTLSGGSVIADTGLNTFTSTTFSGSAEEVVYRESGGTLDFVYQFKDLTGDPVALASESSFLGFTTDVGFASAYNIFGSGTLAPSSVSRNGPPVTGGDVVRFDFSSTPTGGVGNGVETYALVIKTNAISYGPGTRAYQDGTNTSISGFAPAPEPAFTGLLLSGLLGAGLFLARRYRVVQS
jgi:hypothetical protein